MITKVDQVKHLIQKGIQDPNLVFNDIKEMAKNLDWKIREVAATTLVEISKKKQNEVITEMQKWAKDDNENIRRTASEGLRGIARTNPISILPVIEQLKTDENLYVKKSVANILRNAARYDPDFVFKLCKKWMENKNKNTYWIIKDGMKKLKPDQQEYLKQQFQMKDLKWRM